MQAFWLESQPQPQCLRGVAEVGMSTVVTEVGLITALAGITTKVLLRARLRLTAMTKPVAGGTTIGKAVAGGTTAVAEAGLITALVGEITTKVAEAGLITTKIAVLRMP